MVVQLVIFFFYLLHLYPSLHINFTLKVLTKVKSGIFILQDIDQTQILHGEWIGEKPF